MYSIYPYTLDIHMYMYAQWNLNLRDLNHVCIKYSEPLVKYPHVHVKDTMKITLCLNMYMYLNNLSIIVMDKT